MLSKTKDFPLNYPSDVLDVIKAMSFDIKGVRVVGSMALTSQLYAGDYDLYEVVKDGHAASYVKGLQRIVSRLLVMPDVFVGELKAGEISEWRLIPADAHIEKGVVKGFNKGDALRKVDKLVDEGVLTGDEAALSRRLLAEADTPKGFLEAEKELRFHVLRWSPKDVLKGVLPLRNGDVITLTDAIQTPAVVKLDVVAYVQNNKYAEFSIIYSFREGDKTLNPVRDHSLKENLLYYAFQNEWFKAMKRMFSIAKAEGNDNVLKALQPILNGELGRLYSLLSDTGTLIYLVENEGLLPTNKVKYELDQYRQRLASVASLPRVNTEGMLEHLLSVSELPATTIGRKKLVVLLEKMASRFSSALNKHAFDDMREAGLYPLASRFLP